MDDDDDESIVSPLLAGDTINKWHNTFPADMFTYTVFRDIRYNIHARVLFYVSESLKQ